jgi:hypothetical protein
MEGARADFITKLYGEQRARVRELLLAGNVIQFPRVVGVEWRLDYWIKSNTIEKADVPIYYVTLKTKKMVPVASSEQHSGGAVPTPTIENTSFTCTLEQLTELVTTLKDAVKQMERSQA